MLMQPLCSYMNSVGRDLPVQLANYSFRARHLPYFQLGLEKSIRQSDRLLDR